MSRCFCGSWQTTIYYFDRNPNLWQRKCARILFAGLFNLRTGQGVIEKNIGGDSTFSTLNSRTFGHPDSSNLDKIKSHHPGCSTMSINLGGKNDLTLAYPSRIITESQI